MRTRLIQSALNEVYDIHIIFKNIQEMREIVTGLSIDKTALHIARVAVASQRSLERIAPLGVNAWIQLMTSASGLYSGYLPV